MNDFVEFRRVISAILRWAWLLLLITVVVAAAAFLLSRTRSKVYQATGTVLVGNYLHVTAPSRADVDASQALTHTYAQMATQEPILQGVVDALHLSVSWRDLGQRVFVDPIVNTSLLRIEAQASSAAQARAVADELAHQLILHSPSAASTPASRVPTTGASNVLNVVMPAQADARPVRPRTYLDTLIGGVLGFLVGLAVVFILEYRDDAIRTPADASGPLGLPVLGIIDRIAGRLPRARVLISMSTSSPPAEAYRIIRSAISFSTGGRFLRSLVVTSPGGGEGRSLTAANLAIIMARGGMNTVLVDADLRNPVQHELFGLPNKKGLADAVREGEASLDEVLQRTDEPGLMLLAGSEPTANAADLLASLRMRELVSALERRADMVILDSPAVLGLTDASVLSNGADGVLMVVKSGATRLSTARQALSSLRQARANVIGVVVNRGRAKSLVAVAEVRRTVPETKELPIVKGQGA